MKTDYVPITKIDLRDYRYRLTSFSPHPTFKEFSDSLQFVNPVKLIKIGEGLKVITGWKRVSYAVENEMDVIYAQIFGQNELSKENIYRIIYIDNQDRITELEMAELISKLYNEIGLDEVQFVNKILPLFEIKPSKKIFDKFLRISKLDSLFKEAFYREKLTIDQIDMLSHIEDGITREKIFEIILNYRFNNNESRELIRNVHDICARDVIDVDELFKKVIANIGVNASKNNFRKELFRIRYPTLSTLNDLFKEKLDQLDLSDNTTISHHRFFESNNVELKINVRSTDELERSLYKIINEVNSGEFAKLFSLVREGSE